jgi:hypothetical protein
MGRSPAWLQLPSARNGAKSGNKGVREVSEQYRPFKQRIERFKPCLRALCPPPGHAEWRHGCKPPTVTPALLAANRANASQSIGTSTPESMP